MLNNKLLNKNGKFNVPLFSLSITLGSTIITVAMNYFMFSRDEFLAVVLPGVTIALVISTPVSYAVGKMILRIQKLNEQLAYLSSHDFLTKLCTRKHFFEIFQQTDEPTQGSILFVDIDHFKSINDTYGHFVGDEVLKEVAAILNDSVRQEGLVCRFGGEEFVLYLDNLKGKEAKLVADQIRQKIENKQLMITGKLIQTTICIGVAEKNQTDHIDKILQYADKSLYIAKNTGRNKVVLYGDIDSDNSDVDIELTSSKETAIRKNDRKGQSN